MNTQCPGPAGGCNVPQSECIGSCTLLRPAHKGFPAPDPKSMVAIGRVMSTGPRGVTFYKTRALRVGATLYALQEDTPELN